MLSIELLEKFEKEIAYLNKATIVTPSKNSFAVNSGLKGEEKVFLILQKHCEKIYRSVVIWTKKHTFTTEIDFILIINGFLVLVESKEWYGVLDNHIDSSKINLSQLNLKGQFFKQERTSPVAAVGGFGNDLMDFLRNSSPLKKIQLKKFIVFTRDELEIKGDFSSSRAILCHLNKFEEEILKIKSEINLNPYVINTLLPSWDYYYDVKASCWYKAVITSDNIETSDGFINQSDISSILFDDEYLDNALIKLKSNKVISTKINRPSIQINSELRFAQNRVGFIKFDDILHSEVTNNRDSEKNR